MIGLLLVGVVMQTSAVVETSVGSKHASQASSVITGISQGTVQHTHHEQQYKVSK